MKPQNDQTTGQVGQPRQDQTDFSRQVTPPSRNHVDSQRAAADIIRGQIDNLYSKDPITTPTNSTAPQPTATSSLSSNTQNSSQTPSQQTQKVAQHGFRTAPPQNLQASQQLNQSESSPYQRTMANQPSSTQVEQQNIPKQWQQYHSAWQQYYQQYYQRYYMSTAQKETTPNAKKDIETALKDESQTVSKTTANDPVNDDLSQNDAMRELRQSIRQKVTESADKVKKSRHFVPALAGVLVLVLFMFLQFNRVIFGTVAAYVSPGNIEPQNIIVDPTINIEVGPEPMLIIPKININAPVVYGVEPDHDSQMLAMESGVAHFSIPGANAVPGQVGNTVLAAHSSNDVFARGDYKFVFAQNEKLVEGDVIYANYQGTRYTYAVTKTEVVLPSEVSKVQLDTDKPMITLISCVPLGTAQKRLLVFAEQVSPDPKGADQAAADSSEAESDGIIPGQPAPTLLERIFGAS